MFVHSCLILYDSDLYWELHFTVEQYTPDITDPTDKLLKKYDLPEKIEQFLEEGRYNNMERIVTKASEPPVHDFPCYIQLYLTDHHLCSLRRITPEECITYFSWNSISSVKI